MAELIKPKEVTITDQTGHDHHYRIGQIPYLAGGREVCSQYITTAMPKVGDYETNESLARKLFSHVEVIAGDHPQRLTTDALVNNHIPDFVTGLQLEKEAIEHNLGFSIIGRLHESRQAWAAKLPELISTILTTLRDSSPAPDNAPGTNSEPSIPPRTPS